MSVPGSIIRRVLIAGPDRPGFQISRDEWNATLVIDSPAADGTALVRDRSQIDGWGFVNLYDHFVPVSRTINGYPLTSNVVLTKADIGLGNVENVALSSWPGSPNLVIVGTVTNGIWHATPIAPAYGGTGVTTGLTVLDASNLLTGTVSPARLPPEVVLHPFPATDLPPHHFTHEAAGADPIPLDQLAPPLGSTTLDASVAVHGLLPRLPGQPTRFLNGEGLWRDPPATAAITIKGSVPTEGDLPVTGVPGDAWIVEDTGHLWVWDAERGWVDAGLIQGVPGPPGPAGPEASLDYLGDYAPPTTYHDGDIVIGADGIAYLCVKDGVMTPPEPWPGIGISTVVGPMGPPGPTGPPGPAARRAGTIGIVIDGAEKWITPGVKGYLEVGVPCTITAVTLLSTDPAATPGSIVVDIWKETFANYPPLAANSITASAKPTLTSARKSKNTVLPGWTTTIAAGDILAFNVVSSSVVTKVSLTLSVLLGSGFGTIAVVIDGFHAPITTGLKGFYEVGGACTITGVTILSTDPAVTPGSIVIDIWKANYVGFPPTAANSICASAKPTLVASVKSQDTVLTGWNKAIAAGDILAFNVVSASAVQRVSLALTVLLG